MANNTAVDQSARPAPRVVVKALRAVAATGLRLDRSPSYQRGLPRGRKLADGSVEYTSSDGTYRVPPRSENDIIAMHIARGLVFEQEVFDACRPFLPQGGVVLDVGANLGQMSVQFSRAVGIGGLVVSFEAQPFLLPYLETNLRNNCASRSQVVFGAVGDVDGGFLHFPRPDLRAFGSYGSYPIPTNSVGDVGDRVPRVRVDSAVELDRVDFMKVDVQGHDLYVLRGARKTLEIHRPALVFEFEQQFQAEHGTCFQDYIDILREVDYRIVNVINGINYVAVHESRSATATTG